MILRIGLQSSIGLILSVGLISSIGYRSVGVGVLSSNRGFVWVWISYDCNYYLLSKV